MVSPHRILRPLVALALSFAAMAFALGAAAAPRLVVQARTNLRPHSDFTSVSVEVEGNDECGNSLIVQSKSASSSRSWSSGVRVAEIPNMKSGNVRVTVTAWKGDRAVVRRPVRARLSDRVNVVTALLNGETCAAEERREVRKCQRERDACVARRAGARWARRCDSIQRLCNVGAAKRRRECERPATTSGHHRDLLLRLDTGSDDLRSDNQLSVSVVFRNGTRRVIRNVNAGRTWKNHCTNYVRVPLGRRVPLHEIASITLSTSSRGGMGGDNWDLNAVRLLDGPGTRTLRYRSGRPLHRFKGDRRTYSFRVN